MPRAKKQTVNWFPHSCTHGKTIFVLEKKYQLRGYAFWFKLLELLGASEGHFYNYNDPGDREFLQAYTGGGEDSEEMLNLLSSLDAIDREAWEAKIIWSANFIKGIAQTYVNRRVDPPHRPDNYIQEYSPGGITTRSLHKKGQEGKGRELEEGNRKEGNNNKATSPPETGSDLALVPVLFYSCPHFDIDTDYFQQLLADYPGLDKNRMLMEIKKAADYCSDNPKKHKRNSQGKLVNKKLYLRNWMGNATTQGQRGQPMSKAEQVTAANLRAAQEVMKDYE
jgi:hypothetical protein